MGSSPHRLLAAGLLAALVVHAAAPTMAETRLKVGIYENPPTVFVDGEGKPQGLYVDLLDAIAAQEGWTLEYVVGPWAELLERARRGELDLLTAIASSAERDADLDFSREAFAERWGVVYVPRGSAVRGFPDLAGKRVAVAAQDVHGGLFRQVAALLGLDTRVLEVPGYQGVFEAVAGRDADAGVASNAYGLLHAEAHGLAPTTLTFRPTPLVAAFPKGRHGAIARTLDATLARWKADPRSPYAVASQRWLGAPRGEAGSLPLTLAERGWLTRHPKVRVAFDGHFPPYSFLDEAGQPQGFAVDAARLLAARIGVELEVSPHDLWQDLYEAAQRREVDMVATMVDRPERREWFAFTRPYVFKSLVIMARKDGPAITRPEDLAGKTVALVRGYHYVPRVLQEHPTAVPHYVDTMLDGLNAVATGQADAAITYFGAGRYLQTRYLLTNLTFAAVLDRDSSQESFAVRSDWPELAAILDKALVALEPELDALRAKWSTDKALLPPSDRVALTGEEKAWLREHPALRLAPEKSYPPMAFVDEAGEFRGLSADLVKLLEAKLGLRFQLAAPGDLAEVLGQARRGEADVVTSLQETPERSGYLLFTRPYARLPAVILAKADSPPRLALDDLRGRKVAVGKGYAVQEYLEGRHPELRLVPLANDALCLRALAFGEVDAAVVDLASATHTLDREGITGLRVAGDTGYAYQLRLAVRKDWPLLQGILEKGLAGVSEAERQEIYGRWVRLEPPAPPVSRPVLITLAAVFLAAVLGLAGVAAWNRSLRLQVGRKTADLERELAERHRAEIEVRNLAATLESRVEERTRELEDARQALLAALANTSRGKEELERQNRELERFNRLFVDRELRIKELRDRLAALGAGGGTAAAREGGES